MLRGRRALFRFVRRILSSLAIVRRNRDSGRRRRACCFYQQWPCQRVPVSASGLHRDRRDRGPSDLAHRLRALKWRPPGKRVVRLAAD